MFRLLFVIICISRIAHAASWTVCKECAVNTVTEAISKAINGDTIIVQTGAYYEGNIRVDKEITLIGEGFPVLDGEYSNEILTILASNVTVSGFQIQNVGTSYTKDRAGIKVETGKNCIIENNRLQDTFFGIYLAYTSGCIIRNNQVIGTAEAEHSSGNAIHLWYSKNITVENNIVVRHRDGIYLEFVEDGKIIDNQVENNIRYGLHFMFSNSNIYRRNIFRANGAGVAVMFSKRIMMEENEFLDNWGPASYGILLKEITDSRMVKNIFRGNTIGLYAEGANRNVIENNDFIQNGWAIKIMGSCEDNIFRRNNFLSNTFELTTNAKENFNIYEENFWSKYNGYDLNRNGIGDVPHNLVDLFTFIVEQQPPAIILLRSLFIDLLNLAEKITPVLTPSNLRDEKPLMKKVQW